MNGVIWGFCKGGNKSLMVLVEANNYGCDDNLCMKIRDVN